MDIWQWVYEQGSALSESGHPRFAELIDAIPSAVCDGRHAHAEAMIDEALAMARQLEHRWFEVYLRHWRMQSRVLRRREVDENLAECVSLLDFANDDRTRECPQSVCVTQDLASCYGLRDGPGFVAERMAVADETLARIDPSWGCFACISAERASAMIDDEAAEAALEFIGSQRQKIAALGESDPGGMLCGPAQEAYWQLGRFTEGLQENAAWDIRAGGDGAKLERTTKHALFLAELGRADEAERHVPEFSSIREHPNVHLDWCRTHAALSRDAPRPDDDRRSIQMLELSARSRRHGALWIGANIDAIAHRLARSRGRVYLAHEIAEQLREVCTSLARPHSLLADLDASRPPAAARDGDELTAAKRARMRAVLAEDPERGLELVMARRASVSRDPDLAKLEWEALHRCGLKRRGLERLEASQSAHPEDPGLARGLGQQLLAQREPEALERLIGRVRQHQPRTARWLSARLMLSRDELAPAQSILETLLDDDPDDRASQWILAEVCARRGDRRRQLDVLDRIVRDADPGPADWDRIVAATLLERWDRVRDSCQRLGIELGEGDGRPDAEGWGMCRIRVDSASIARNYYARRTGPVTASIVEIAHPDHPQHYGDELVFDPEPIEAPEGEHAPPPLFARVETIRAGGYRSYGIEGVHPGADTLQHVRAQLPHEWVLQIRSGDSYEIRDANQDVRIGLYAWLALPASVTAEEATAELARLCARFEVDWHWPALSRDAGDEDEAERQLATLRTLGINPD